MLYEVITLVEGSFVRKPGRTFGQVGVEEFDLGPELADGLEGRCEGGDIEALSYNFV